MALTDILPKSRGDLAASLDSATAELDDLRADLAAVTAQRDQLSATSEQLSADLQSREAELAEATTTLEALTAQRDALQASQSDFDASVATATTAAVAEELAKIGHPPVTGDLADDIDSAATARDAADFQAAYDAIEDPAERTKFFRENRGAFDLPTYLPRPRR